MPKKFPKIQTWLPYVLGAALLGLIFWTGTLYQQVKMLQKGGAGGSPLTAQEENGPELGMVADSLWQEMLEAPAAALGEATAPVVIVEFLDYQCPFCQQAFAETVPQIKSQYLESGQVRFLVHDLPLSIHPNAEPAALAARCAGEQGKYFEMHDQLFDSQQDWSVGNPKNMFKTYARSLGLNASKFNSCYDMKKYEAAINADMDLAARANAIATPTFFINQLPVIGAQPFAAFEQLIDEKLGK